jgi:hypothetical protein
MIDLYGDFDGLFCFCLEVLRKKFGQIFAIIQVILMNVFQKIDKSFQDVYLTRYCRLFRVLFLWVVIIYLNISCILRINNIKHFE